jgi:hypothetical protein
MQVSARQGPHSRLSAATARVLTCPLSFRRGQEEKRYLATRTQQLSIRSDLDFDGSRGYAFVEFAIVIHQARFNQRSVGSLESAKRRAEAGTCGRSLITRRSLDSPGLRQGRIAWTPGQADPAPATKPTNRGSKGLGSSLASGTARPQAQGRPRRTPPG